MALDHQPPRATTPLTRRQHEVLRLIAEGRSNREIATALGMAEGTVRTHVMTIFRTLAVARRADAVAVARRMGLLAERADY